METLNNTQAALRQSSVTAENKQISKQDVIKQIKQTMQMVDPTAKVILHQAPWNGEDLDKIVDLVVVLDKDKISWDEECSVMNPLVDLEDQLEYQYAILPYVVPRTRWFNNNQPAPLYNYVMNHQNGTVLC